MARSASSTERFSSTAFAAASAQSLRTVRMVPSTGFLTAWNATSFALAKIVPKSWHVSLSASPQPSQKPRRICDVMTPELPRAPMSAPVVIAFFLSASELVGASSDRFFTTDSIVSDILVPVSPSGTGKTLSLLTSSFRSVKALDAKAMAPKTLLIE